MKNIKIISFLSIFLLLACRKDPELKVDCCFNPNQESCSGLRYRQNTFDEYDRLYKELKIPDFILTPPSFSYNGQFEYASPNFNPNDPYSIVYSRSDHINISTFESEIWTYDFCSGNHTLIADNLLFNLDWGDKDWLLYTGTGYQLFKIKSNGDSLIQLTSFSGINKAGKWSVSGDKFWLLGDTFFRILDENGNELYYSDGLPNFSPTDWIDNNTLLVVLHSTNSFHSFNYLTGELIEIRPEYVCGGCAKIYDRANSRVYISNGNAEIDGSNLVKFNLKTGESESINDRYQTYKYGWGDYSPQTQKIMITLDRSDWKDSANIEIHSRRDILFLDTDGSNERLFEMPK